MGSNLYPELVRHLRKAGCEFARQGKGSHEIWFSPITKRRFSASEYRQGAHGQQCPEGRWPGQNLLTAAYGVPCGITTPVAEKSCERNEKSLPPVGVVRDTRSTI